MSDTRVEAVDAASRSGPVPPTRVLLVEDDEGDAFLVRELLIDSAPDIYLNRVSTLQAAEARLPGDFDCVLLDLGLPDAEGMDALRLVLNAAPNLAVLVLTGVADEFRGIESVSYGAQDYLVKGNIDGEVLHRAIRYAVERKRADESMRRLYASEARAAENARLERGLLPQPLVSDTGVQIVARYTPGRHQALLGGDFYDVVERADGDLFLLIGDVAGHGPDEAALGVCLRVAWRTLTLAGAAPEAVLPTMQRVLVHERVDEEIFATVLTVIVAPDRRTASLRSAGHPPPVLLGDEGPRALDVRSGLPLGVLDGPSWPVRSLSLPHVWGLLLSTDGLIEGRAGPDTSRRLAMEGLIGLVRSPRGDERWSDDPDAFVAGLIDEVMRRNGGVPLDDVAALLLTGRRTDR